MILELIAFLTEIVLYSKNSIIYNTEGYECSEILCNYNYMYTIG